MVSFCPRSNRTIHTVQKLAEIEESKLVLKYRLAVTLTQETGRTMDSETIAVLVGSLSSFRTLPHVPTHQSVNRLN